MILAISISAFRVGNKQSVERLSSGPEELLEQAKAERQSETVMQLFTTWARKEKAFEEILILQKRQGLSDELWNQHLMQHWQSTLGASQVAPGLLAIGNADWRPHIDWDVQELEEFMLNKAAVPENDLNGDHDPQKNIDSHD